MNDSRMSTDLAKLIVPASSTFKARVMSSWPKTPQVALSIRITNSVSNSTVRIVTVCSSGMKSLAIKKRDKN